MTSVRVGGAVGSRGVEEENGAGGIEAAPGDGLLAVGVEVREDENLFNPFNLFNLFNLASPAQQGERVALAALDHLERGAGGEGGEGGEDRVEAADGGDLVVGRAPAQGGGAVDVDLLRREPLDAVRDAEAALARRERGEGGAHPGVGARARGEAVVVVRLGVVRERADLGGHRLRAGEVALEGRAVLGLEDLRVGPVEPLLGDEVARHRNLAAEPLEEEDRVGELLAHARHDVAPRLGRDHVAGVAAEAVDALRAPELEDRGEERAQLRTGVVELDEVLPDRAPRARAVEAAVGLAAEPFRVVRLQRGGPARVVRREVDEEPRAARVDRVRELAELVERRRRRVELREPGVHREEVRRGERRAEAAHAGERRRDRMHRQQLHDAEALVEEDRVEARDEVAQRALARDRRPSRRVERGGALGERGRALERAVRTELARERAVDRAPADRPGGRDLHQHIAALGPERAVRALGEEAGLRVERADVDEREADREAADAGGAGRFDLLHRDVVPVEREGRAVGVHRLDELAPLPLRAAEGGAQDGAAAGGGRALDAELEDDVVAAVAQQRGGRGGGLDQMHGPAF